MQADSDSAGEVNLALPRRLADWLFRLLALYFFVYLSHYYITGAAGPTRLAVAMVPVTVVLVFLNDARRGELYPALGDWMGFLLAVIYAAIGLSAAWYLLDQFDADRKSVV